MKSQYFKTNNSSSIIIVEWDFLEAIMGYIGYHDRLVRVYHAMCAFGSFSFNLNRRLVDNIIPHRGIRQGIPSPISSSFFLFRRPLGFFSRERRP